MTTVLATLMVAGAIHGAPTPGTAQSDDTCVIVRISPQGRRTVIDEDHPDHDRYRWSLARTGVGGTYASASSSGTSSSSVSVSSSSHNGRSTSSATTRDDDGERTVTTTRDGNGCTTVVDERPAQRSDR